MNLKQNSLVSVSCFRLLVCLTSSFAMNDDNETFDAIPSNSSSDLPDSTTSPNDDPVPDTRLYVPDHEEWDVRIKRDSDRIYCYSKHPGQDWFHLILSGEIYVTRQHERYCLRCALRMNFLTQDRLFWQHRVPKKPTRVI